MLFLHAAAPLAAAVSQAAVPEVMARHGVAALQPGDVEAAAFLSEALRVPVRLDVAEAEQHEEVELQPEEVEAALAFLSPETVEAVSLSEQFSLSLIPVPPLGIMPCNHFEA